MEDDHIIRKYFWVLGVNLHLSIHGAIHRSWRRRVDLFHAPWLSLAKHSFMSYIIGFSGVFPRLRMIGDSGDLCVGRLHSFPDRYPFFLFLWSYSSPKSHIRYDFFLIAANRMNLIQRHKWKFPTEHALLTREILHPQLIYIHVFEFAWKVLL